MVGSGATTGVLSPEKGDPSDRTGEAGIFDGSELWENSVGAQETGLATVVIVDLRIFTANEINIMKKKLGPISVVLDCFRVPCVRQISSKKGGEPIIATRCWMFAIEEPQHHNYSFFMLSRRL
jgi:hypothetical protein